MIKLPLPSLRWTRHGKEVHALIRKNKPRTPTFGSADLKELQTRTYRFKPSPMCCWGLFQLDINGSMGSSLNASWQVSNNLDSSPRGMYSFTCSFPHIESTNQAWLNIDKYWWTLRSWYFQTTCELQSLPSIHLITSHRCQATHGHGHHSLSNVARALPWQGGYNLVLKGSPSDRV